jgi:DNA/RNA-binding domain of Phe-tRNA-synthetase-like protein
MACANAAGENKAVLKNRLVTKDARFVIGIFPFYNSKKGMATNESRHPFVIS